MNNPCTILIIDDNPDDIIITRRAISKVRTDCTVIEASDEEQALECLNSQLLPSLILLDLKMPGSDGIDILKYIRSGEYTRYIPVVILTSSIMEKDLRISYDAGANSFLHKTHDLDEFTETLRTAINYWVDLNLSPE